MLLKGIEEEVYAGTTDGEIVGFSPRAAADLPWCQTEPDDRNIEYMTTPTRDYESMGLELRGRRRRLANYLRDAGDYVLVPGSCMALPYAQELQLANPKNPYYRYIKEAYGTTVVTTSTHINIGIDDPELIIRANRLVRLEACLYLALTAASPFLNGRVTGSHSTRWQIFPITPGDVPLFSDHGHYVEWINCQLASRAMFNIRHIWLSVRPNGVEAPNKLDRLELRICDRIDELPVLQAATALLEARVLQVLEDPGLDPLTADWLPRSQRAEDLVALAATNDAAVADASLDAPVRRWQDGRTVSAREWLGELLATVRPTAAEYRFERYLTHVDDILRNGNPAMRWLETYKSGMSIRDILKGEIAVNQEHTEFAWPDVV